MPLSSFHDRDMDEQPFTIGEFIKYLSEFPRERELRFMGMSGELFFHRFKQRGENLETIEFDDPGFMELMAQEMITFSRSCFKTS